MANLSGDRIYDEVTKILALGSDGLYILDKMGFLKTLFPDVAALKGLNHGPYHLEGDPFVHTALVLDHYVMLGGNNPLVLWALLLHDIGKSAPMPNRGTYPALKWNTGKFYRHEELSAQMAKVVLAPMIGKNLSAKDADVIVWLVENHMNAGRSVEMKKAKRGRLFDNPNFRLLLDVLRADSMGRIPQGMVWVEVNALYERHQMTYNPVSVASGPSLKALGINGNALMHELNIGPGKRVGELLNIAQDMLYENANVSREEIMAVLAS